MPVAERRYITPKLRSFQHCNQNGMMIVAGRQQIAHCRCRNEQ